MPLWPETRNTLITRLKNPADQQAWSEFSELYQGLIYRFARSRGLQDADASDITQRVLWSVARAAETWSPDKGSGRFRGWLARVTTNAVINLVQRENHHRGSGRSSICDLLESSPDKNADKNADIQADWTHQRRLQLFRFAANQVRPKFTDDVWQAFWRTSVDGVSIADVAADQDKTIGAIYAARSRVLAKIRQQVADIERLESSESEAAS